MQDYISRFNYYAHNIRQVSDIGRGPKTIEENQHSAAQIGLNSYHYLRHKREPFNNQSLLTKSLLSGVATESLLPKDAEMHNPLQFKAELNHETENVSKRVVDVLVVEDIAGGELKSSRKRISLQRLDTIATSKSIKSDSKNKSYNVYVIHFPVQGQQWSYFVERITLKENHFDSDMSWPIQYEGIIAFPKENWFQKNIQKYFVTSPQMLELTNIAKDIRGRLDIFESNLAKTLAGAANEGEDNYDCHIEFKRQSQLPPAEYKKFERLRTQTYRYFVELNKDRKLNRYFLDNLVCRYMMVKKYNQEESLKSIKKYLVWENDMRQRNSMQKFKKYSDLGIFKYIGKDNEGRPMLYFKSSRYLPDKIENIKEYMEYNAYLFEIFTQDQMEGYIDQYIIVADYNDFSTANFKYGPAKDFSEIGNQYFPERQYKLILFGVGSFGEWIYKVLKPVLPEFIIRKIVIFGHDIQALTLELEKYMDIKQLPQEIFVKSENPKK